MDRLVDEAEGLVDGSASICSSSSGRTEPPTEQQLNILNSITASDLSGTFPTPDVFTSVTQGKIKLFQRQFSLVR